MWRGDMMLRVASGIVVANSGMKVSSRRLFHRIPILLDVHHSIQDETTCRSQLENREGTVYVHVSIPILYIGLLESYTIIGKG